MDESQLRTLIDPILQEEAVEVVECTARPQSGVLLIRLLVDKVGGMTLQDCTRLNRLIDQAMETNALIAGSYTLEVSSPGLDRPLSNRRDYERALGEDVLLLLRTDNGGVRESVGQLLAVQAEAVVLKTTAGNVTVPLIEITKATKVIKL